MDRVFFNLVDLLRWAFNTSLAEQQLCNPALVAAITSRKQRRIERLCMKTSYGFHPGSAEA